MKLSIIYFLYELYISFDNLLIISCFTELQIMRDLKYIQDEMKKEREQRKYSL